jgi:serine/threonine protein kinase HipA of HipAB toxin-antitoxin module
MRNPKASGLRLSIGAVAAVTVTGLIVFLFESPYTAWGTHTQAPSEEIAISAPAADRDTSNV